jgi:signal transduction histidine kinase
MQRSRLIAITLLTGSIIAMVGVGTWQMSQSRKHAFTVHERWAERVAQRLIAERNTVASWLEDLQGLDRQVVRRELMAQPDFVGAYWFNVRTHEFEKWVMPEYKNFLGPPDPRLILAQLRATQTKRMQYGPLFLIGPAVCVSVAQPMGKQNALVVIQSAPGVRKIVQEESSWSHWKAWLMGFAKEPFYVGGDKKWIEKALGTIIPSVGDNQKSGTFSLNKKGAWRFFSTYHVSSELDTVLLVGEPIAWVYYPILLFFICIFSALWLVALPLKAREQLRRAREASDLADFAKRVDKFVHGKDVTLQEPPYPFKELNPIVLSLRWLLPQWKKAEAYPQEYGLERKLLSLLIESLPEGILFFNAQGALQMGNELGKVFLALHQEAGREFKMMSGVQVPRGFLEPYAEPVFTDQQKNLGKEIEVGWADGKHLYRVWVEAVEVDDKAQGYIIVIRDITFRKQWEYVQEQVLSGITHDLRGPLSAIMGYIDLLKRQIKDGPPKALEYLAMARDAGNRLTQMISDILDVVRFEQGKIEMEVQAISVSQMFERLKNIFGVTANQKGVTLAFKMESGGILVSGDPKLLERILDNLVGNAIKFTPASGTITIAASRVKNRTVFSVADTGRGIPKEAQSRIFDKFQQVRPGDRSGGYGLGLAVVKFIVDAHKGEIRVESVPDKGSTFTFWIPDQAVTAKAEPSPEASGGEVVH